ncbi:MAG: peptidoglycan-binding protein [Clostridia bacterium]|nr:peptidoglycan-binding protein [Clostridia bacterium]
MMKRLTILLLALALTTAALTPALAQETLKSGDTGDAVMELNTRLRQLNYSDAPGRNAYTDATVAAVKAVQNAYGLPETGEADEKTLAIIYGECYRPLTINSKGEEVKLLQEKLKELGYYSGNVTGNYQDGTAKAVKAFQSACSIEASGVADVKTQEKLYSLSVRPTPTPSPVPSPTPARTASPTPGPRQEFGKTLKYGSTGKDVQKVQQRLKDLGFFTYPKITDGFYKATQAAVEDFQKKNGLKATGTVDSDTWEMLFNNPDVRGIGDETRDALPPLYFFEVDVANQVVKVWKYNTDDAGYTDLDRCFLCATGTTKYPSPLGTFTLTGRRAAYCRFPTWGGGEARWWTRITSEIAFHSVLYSDASDPNTLKVSSLTGLGKRGSHGCIRLTVADAKWIYDHAKEDMKVWIHDDAALDPELRYAIQPGELNKNSMLPNTTPAPTAFPDYDGTKAPASAARALKVGSEGEDVYWLQMKLKELGFYPGTVTGQYREGTRDAVKAYQKARKMSQTGNADKQTLTTLYGEVNKGKAAPAPTATPKPTAKAKPTVTKKPTAKPTAKPKK